MSGVREILSQNFGMSELIITSFPLRMKDSAKMLALSPDAVDGIIKDIVAVVDANKDSFNTVQLKGKKRMTPTQSYEIHDKIVDQTQISDSSVSQDGLELTLTTKKGKTCVFRIANCSTSKWILTLQDERPVSAAEKRAIGKEKGTPKQERKRIKACKEDPPTVKKEEPSGKEARRQSMHVDSLLSLKMAINSPLPESTKSTDSQYTYKTIEEFQDYDVDDVSVD